MFDFVTVGGATQDIFIESDHGKILTERDFFSKQELICFDYGAKIEIDKLAYDIGGGAVNTAVNLANLGFKTSTLVKIGNDLNAKAINARLDEKNIDKSLLLRTNKYKTGFSVILTSFEGERTVLTHRGANSHITPDEVEIEKIKNTKWLYIASLSGVSNEILDELAYYAGQNNIKMAFNPGTAQIKRGINDLKKVLSSAEVLIMNKEEASKITGIQPEATIIDYDKCDSCEVCIENCPQKVFDVRDEKIYCHQSSDKCPLSCSICTDTCTQDAIAHEPWSFGATGIIKKLKDAGPKIVVITDGKNGVQAYDGDILYYAPPYPSAVLSTLGAGDAFASTFVATLEKYDWFIDKALKYASINSASVIESFGAQTGLKNFDDLENSLSATPDFDILKKTI